MLLAFRQPLFGDRPPAVVEQRDGERVRINLHSLHQGLFPEQETKRFRHQLGKPINLACGGAPQKLLHGLLSANQQARQPSILFTPNLLVDYLPSQLGELVFQPRPFVAARIQFPIEPLNLLIECPNFLCRCRQLFRDFANGFLFGNRSQAALHILLGAPPVLDAPQQVITDASLFREATLQEMAEQAACGVRQLQPRVDRALHFTCAAILGEKFRHHGCGFGIHSFARQQLEE